MLEERTKHMLDVGDVPTAVRQVEVDDPLSDLAGPRVGLDKVLVQGNDDSPGRSGPSQDLPIGDSPQTERQQGNDIQAEARREVTPDLWRQVGVKEKPRPTGRYQERTSVLACSSWV